jgi:DNA-binding LacI/PurR family transcriptional regulator
MPDRLSNAFADPNAVEFLQGVGDACEQSGRSLLLIPVTADTSQADTVAGAAVDGFVVYAMPPDDPHVAAVARRHQPMVIVDGPRGVPRVDFVGITDRTGMAELTRFVVSLGHRRLAFVGAIWGVAGTTGPADLDTMPGRDRGPLAERVAGVRAGLEGTSARVVGYRCAHSSFAAGLSAGRQLFGGPARPAEVPTAVLCFSDALALGVRTAAEQIGLRVPDDVTITGFDDIPGAAVAGLTTVRQPTRQKGRRAVALLDAARAARRRVIELPTELIVRASSGPPPR